MKATHAKDESEICDDIVQTLKRVPKARLGVVCDLVYALATSQSTNAQPRAPDYYIM